MSQSTEAVDIIRIEAGGEDWPTSLPAKLHVGVQAYGAAAEFTLLGAEPGGTAATVLSAGQPLVAELRGGDWLWYSFTPAAEGVGAITFTLTPLSGDPDLYVSQEPTFSASERWTCAEPLFGAPTCAASLEAAGATDQVVFLPGDQLYCTACTYRVLVAAATYTSFSILAQVGSVPGGGSVLGGGGKGGGGGGTDDAPVTALLPNIPTRGSVSANEYSFYRVPVSSTNRSLTVRLTSLSGDPDLYASFSELRPTEHTAEFHSGELGDDALFLSHYDPRFCNGTREGDAGCSLHLGVGGYMVNASYSLAVSFGEESKLSLISGQPQEGSLEAHAWQYYTIALGGGDVDQIVVSLEASYGDPDVYIKACPPAPPPPPGGHAGDDACPLPSLEDSGWSGTASGGDMVRVADSTGDGWCLQCTYTIGVVAFTRSAFTITATSGGPADHPTRLLQQGVPAHGQVGVGDYVYYSVQLEPAQDVWVTLTATSGDPDMYSSFVSTAPSQEDYQFAARDPAATDELHISHSEETYCKKDGRERTPCVLVVAVYGFEQADFSIVAVQTPEAPVQLQDGAPQQVAQQGIGEWRYFEYTVGALPPAEALLLKAGKNCKSHDKYLGHFDDLAACASACEWEEDCAFFEYGTGDKVGECYAEWTASDCKEGWEDAPYNFYALAQTKGAFTVSISPTMGDPDLYISKGRTQPTEEEHGWRAVSPGADAIRVDSGDPDWCGLCTYTIGVLTPQTASAYSVVASTGAKGTVLEDSKPMLRVIPAGDGENYRLYVPGQGEQRGLVSITVSATAISGGVRLFANTTGWPNATHHQWASDPSQPAEAGAGARLHLDDDALSVCVSSSPNCVLYLRAEAVGTTDASISIVAQIERPDSGLLIDFAQFKPGGKRKRWSDAESSCSSSFTTQGGHLARIANEDEQALVQRLCTKQDSGDRGCWIGFTDAANETVWEWSDGDDPQWPTTYTNWAPGEPNGGLTESTDAASMYAAGPNVGKWDDTWGEADEQKRHYICRVDERTPHVFGSAAFGPPLPTTPLLTALVLADPPTACEPIKLTRGPSGEPVKAPLNKTKMAVLIKRGDCDFVVKARNAQAAGASAALIYDRVSGPILTMIAGDNDASDIGIPSIIITKEKGTALATRLKRENSNNSRLYATLRLPLERDVALSAGIPLQGHLEAQGYALHRLTVSHASRILISVSASSATGDIDLYVSSDGTPPTTTHYGWAAMALGADFLELRPDEEGYVGGDATPGTYIIGAYNAGGDEATYTIVATVGGTPILAPAGTPLNGRAALGEPMLYRYLHAPGKNASALQMAVAALSGNPDLCVSRNASAMEKLPLLSGATDVAAREAAEKETEAFRAAIAEHCTWHRELDGSDTLTVRHDEPEGGPGWYYAAVFTDDASAQFTFTARVVDGKAVPLEPNQPASGGAPTGGWSYYALNLGDDSDHPVEEVSLVLTATLGEPDLFVSFGEKLPGRADAEHDAAKVGGRSAYTLTLPASDLGTATRLLIGVQAEGTPCAFSLTATVTRRAAKGEGSGGSGGFPPASPPPPSLEPVLRLLPATPMAMDVSDAGVKNFEYVVPSPSTDLELVVTPLGGEWESDRPPQSLLPPKLLAVTGGPNEGRATPAHHDFPPQRTLFESSTVRDAGERNVDARGSWTYKLVQSSKRCRAAHADLGTASSAQDCAAKCRASADGCAYFTYGRRGGKCHAERTTSSACPEGLERADLELYALFPPWDEATSLRIAAQDAAPASCAAASGGAGCVLHAAVICDAPPCHFSVVAAPADQPIKLVGQAQRRVRPANEWAYFSVRVAKDATDVVLTMRVESGSPSLCVVETVDTADDSSPDFDSDDREDGACPQAHPARAADPKLVLQQSDVAADAWLKRSDGDGSFFTLELLPSDKRWCTSCSILLAAASPEAASTFTLTAVVGGVSPAGGGGHGGGGGGGGVGGGGSAVGAVFTWLLVIGVIAGGGYVGRKRYVRGQPLVPGFVKNFQAPSMDSLRGMLPASLPSLRSSRSRAQVSVGAGAGAGGPGAIDRARSALNRRTRGTRLADQELRSYDAPLAPGDGFNPVPSPLHGGAPPAGGSYVAPVLAPAGGIAPADEEPTVTPLTSVAAAQAAAAARV